MKKICDARFFVIGKTYRVILPHVKGNKPTMFEGIITSNNGRYIDIKASHGSSKHFEVDCKKSGDGYPDYENLQAEEIKSGDQHLEENYGDEYTKNYGAFAGKRRKTKKRKTRRRHTRRR
jgi:hypothetical protein